MANNYSLQLPPPRRIRPKGIADVVFCLDCTGSMQPCLEGLKTNLQQLVAGFGSAEHIQLDWRVRLIEYRDLREEEPILANPFTTDLEEFRTQVGHLRAEGGGDEPESTLDALHRALQSEWRPHCNKCVVLFTDATAHPPQPPVDLDLIIQELQAQKAQVFLYGPRCPHYEQLARVSRVLYEPTGSATGLAELDFHRVLDYVGKTISQSTVVRVA